MGPFPSFDVSHLTHRGIRDAYLDVLLGSSADPSISSLLFSCGMGAVRTTFAMCASSIVRRRQLVLKGLPDPYDISSVGSGASINKHVRNSPSLLGSGPPFLDESGASTVNSSALYTITPFTFASLATWRSSCCCFRSIWCSTRVQQVIAPINFHSAKMCVLTA